LGALSARRSDFVKDDGSGDHSLRPFAGAGRFQGTANLLAAVFVIPEWAERRLDGADV
jgi:hypothetical protein